jgi:glycosyltransferase involved in cell wall biosynthesis
VHADVFIVEFAGLRLCFVVHRYAPYPGGTEIYVQGLAEECLGRGHETWVFTHQHRGDLNGVRLTSDIADICSGFDLIIVHGSVKGAQSQVLESCGRFSCPVLYMIISHTDHGHSRSGLRDATWLGWSTEADLARITNANAAKRAVRVRHGVNLTNSLGTPGFRMKYGVAADRQMLLSCGGYWPHKRMKPLARLLRKLKGDALLVTTGYQRSFFHMPRTSSNVLPLLIADRRDVLSAMREADCYIMHSEHEGFGLVLLEAMLNRTPWMSFNTGAAAQLNQFGTVYDSGDELVAHLSGFRRDEAKIERAFEFVRDNHLVGNSVDDILAVAAKDAS